MPTPIPTVVSRQTVLWAGLLEQLGVETGDTEVLVGDPLEGADDARLLEEDEKGVLDTEETVGEIRTEPSGTAPGGM